MGRLHRLCFAACAVAIGCSAAPQVLLGHTVVNGAVGAAGTEFFGGIPFAKPPVGKLRFSPPVGVTTLSSATFDATKFGPSCLQPNAVPDQSEDCLSVNVFRPAGTTAKDNLPVMAWIYGGGFAEGISSLTNATLLVAASVARGTPIVYVSMNYRVGPMGFPTGSEAEKNGALNLGLKDQLAALRWIQANVGKFGGDKNKVTLFGESAGAISIADLFLNSNLESLIRAAIFESGSQATAALRTPASGTSLWQAFAKAVPACKNANPNNTFDCLRAAPAADLVTADQAVTGKAFDFVPVIDGRGGVVPDFPSTLISSGRFSKIPFITGTNLDEGTLFTPTTINSTDALVAFLKTPATQLSGTPVLQNLLVSDLLALYPDNPAAGSPFNTGNETFGLPPEFKRAAAISGDVAFQSLRRAWINAAAGEGVKTFGYLFTEPQIVSEAPGVSHASEIAYVYGQLIIPGQQPGPGFATLSKHMIDYWLSFAVSLDPNDGKGSPRPKWPQFTPTNQVLMQLNSQNLTVIPDDYRKDQLAFINLLPSVFGH